MNNFFESNYWIFIKQPFNKRKRREIRSKIKNNHFKSLAPEALKRLSHTFKNYNKPLEIWLEFGTLLGAYRDGKIIDYDYDLDFGISEGSITHDFIKHLDKNGFKLKHNFEIKSDNTLNNFISEYTFIYKNIVLIDFFVFKMIDSKLCSFAFDKENGLTWAQTLSKYDQCLRTTRRDFTPFELKLFNFYGADFYIPQNTELHLTEAYGEDFMIPKVYSYDDRPKNYETLLNASILGYMRNFID